MVCGFGKQADIVSFASGSNFKKLMEDRKA